MSRRLLLSGRGHHHRRRGRRRRLLRPQGLTPKPPIAKDDARPMRIVLSALISLASCTPADFPTLPGAHQGDAEPPDLPWAETWPPDGAFGVPPEPELLAVHLDDAPHTLSISVDGTQIAFEQREENCATLGFDGGRCLRLLPQAPLPRAGELRVQVDGATIATMSLGE